MVIIVAKKRQFLVFISVDRKGQFSVVIRVVKSRKCKELLLWLKRGGFG